MRCGAACEKVKSYLKMVAQAGIVKSVWSEADAGTVLNDWATATWQLQHVERERTNTKYENNDDVNFSPSCSYIKIALLPA